MWTLTIKCMYLAVYNIAPKQKYFDVLRLLFFHGRTIQMNLTDVNMLNNILNIPINLCTYEKENKHWNKIKRIHNS